MYFDQQIYRPAPTNYLRYGISEVQINNDSIKPYINDISNNSLTLYKATSYRKSHLQSISSNQKNDFSSINNFHINSFSLLLSKHISDDDNDDSQKTKSELERFQNNYNQYSNQNSQPSKKSTKKSIYTFVPVNSDSLYGNTDIDKTQLNNSRYLSKNNKVNNFDRNHKYEPKKNNYQTPEQLNHERAIKRLKN